MLGPLIAVTAVARDLTEAALAGLEPLSEEEPSTLVDSDLLTGGLFLATLTTSSSASSASWWTREPKEEPAVATRTDGTQSLTRTRVSLDSVTKTPQLSAAAK